MAQSRRSSNGPDWKDVTQALVNFEEFWDCSITLSIRADGSPGAKFLMLEGKAEPRNSTVGVVLHSVCVSTSMRQLNAGSLSAAMLNLLHKLDREVEIAKPMGSPVK